MGIKEFFAKMSFDKPIRQSAAKVEAALQTSGDDAVWKKPIVTQSPEANKVRSAVGPAPGQPYRMVPVEQLLNVLWIANYGDNYLDESAQIALEQRLRRNGLALATTITGALRLRVADIVPVIDINQPQPSRYTAVTTCLYIIAWMLEADSPTTRDLEIVDAWIDGYDPKEDWAAAAKGTLRWLLSRKLFFTAKRKQRTGRVKRYPNVRNKLLSVLLSLVADPNHASPKRMKRLETIYATLDLDPADIHADIHRLATTETISHKAVTKADNSILSTAKLQQMSDSTRKAQAMLSDVFSEPEKETVVAVKEAKANPIADIIAVLAEKEEWERSDAEALAKSHGMTLGAMLERVNDLAYEKADAPVAEDDDENIYIDCQIALEIIGNQ